MCDITHTIIHLSFVSRTDCSTNYLIKDPPTKVGKKRKFFVIVPITLCHML